MTNYFCDTCGTLMYRVGSRFPGQSILRLGTVDDFNLHETSLRPRVEIYCKDRVDWLRGVDGARQFEVSADASQGKGSREMEEAKSSKEQQSCAVN